MKKFPIVIAPLAATSILPISQSLCSATLILGALFFSTAPIIVKILLLAMSLGAGVGSVFLVDDRLIRLLILGGAL
ncbi:MAG: hypothetical protein V2G41_09405 [bacterium JZ-2024 1]